MKTLIIPDIHERIHALKFLEDHIKAADRVVQLAERLGSGPKR